MILMKNKLNIMEYFGGCLSASKKQNITSFKCKFYSH